MKTFTEWMKQVDTEVQKLTAGLSADDLSDYCYADAYEDEMSPRSVARAAIRASGG